MKTIEGLSNYLKERINQLNDIKKKGIKIVGYIPCGFIPEELVWASGAIPIGLNCGGDYNAVIKSIEFIPRFIDTYARSQIGFWALGEPKYQLPDLVVVPCTDKNIQVISDSWEMWTDTKLFRLGIPHTNKTNHAFKYYLDGLYELKDQLEQLTNVVITESELRREINVSNKIRYLLRQIRTISKSRTPPISGSDFIKLHHASFILDRNFMAEYLESIYEKLKDVSVKQNGPRIFLIGSSVASGDYKVYNLLESAGANIVLEDFSEGMRPYWDEIGLHDDLFRSLADTYFGKRTLLPAFFRPNKERYSILLKLAKEYKVDGIVWYSMMYREPYEIEGIHFGRMAEKEGYRFLRLVSDYDRSEYEVFRTRIEAFVESI